MLEFFSSRFMHYSPDIRLLQGNHNMLCDIHIFSATTTAEALHFSIQELIIVECSGHVQVKFCVVFLCKEKFVWLFHAKIKFCVFFQGTLCTITLFHSSVNAIENIYEGFTYRNESAVRFSQIKTKLSYLAIGKAQLNACAFSDGVERQKCCPGPGDIKTVITFLLYNF